MSQIKKVHARQILDSRGNPTIEVDVFLADGNYGSASVPSGASTGQYEAMELRDNNTAYFGKTVYKAVNNVNNEISQAIHDMDVHDYKKIDKILIELDGTDNKSRLGANSILGTSLACIHAAAKSNKKSLFEYLNNGNEFVLPAPMMNIINGGSHADNNVDIQEFMIFPLGASSFSEALQMGTEIFHILKSVLQNKGMNTSVGDEGGFAPNINSSNEVIEIIIEAVLSTGLKMNKDIMISLDVAATEFFFENKYNLKGENKILDSDQMIDYLKKLSLDYPIYSIEDGMSENDWHGWKNLTNEIGKNIQLVGDDLFVTNIKRLQEGIDKDIANSILVKLNQIGTLTETINAINLAKENNYSCIISHRSGETEDTTISDLSVATSAGQIKTGSLSRTDRTSKYNQLIRIEEILGDKCYYAGRNILIN